MEQIHKFIKQTQKRLNGLLLKREAINCFLVLAIGVLGTALVFVGRGYKVNYAYLLIPAVIAGLVFILRYLSLRYDELSAAKFADRFFQLNDSLVTAAEFDRKSFSEGFYSLQKKHAAQLVSNKNVADIQHEIPRKLVVVGIVLSLVSFWFCLFDDADFVKKRLQLEQENRVKSQQINKQLKNVLKKIAEQLSTEEKEMLKKGQLPKLLKNLKVTKDRKEALKQYARLEKELRKLTERSKMAQDEKMLAEIAKKLMKNKPFKKLGQHLTKKHYDKAASNLSKMKMKGKPQSKENRENLKKLSKLAERMKDATANYKTGKQGLKKQVSSLSKALEQMKKSMQQQNANQQQQMSDKLNQQLGKMSQYLKQHGTKRKFMKNMNALKQALMMAQSQMRKKGQKSNIFAMSKQQGKEKGKGVGAGTDNTTNKTVAKSQSKGYFSKLKGQKGKGPSDISLEDAGSGKGISSVSGQKGRQEYKFQLESYIQREDVPAVMKSGVKQYFKSIHKETE